MIGSGVELMFIGMAVVFCFLLMLVGLINLTSKLLKRWEPSQPYHSNLHTPTAPSVKPEPEDPAVIAAITTAIKMFRSRSKR